MRQFMQLILHIFLRFSTIEDDQIMIPKELFKSRIVTVKFLVSFEFRKIRQSFKILKIVVL